MFGEISEQNRVPVRLFTWLVKKFCGPFCHVSFRKARYRQGDSFDLVKKADLEPVPVGFCLRNASYLVDPASSYMLVSKIKPCMSKYKHVLHCETADGSLYQL